MNNHIKKYIGGTAFLLIVALLGSLFHVSQEPASQEETFLYITLATEPLPNESSSYELQRAAEHFSDLVLGWTVEPGFEFDVSFNGRRQEKQNLLFVLDTDDLDQAGYLLDEIQSRISTYNENANSHYLIAGHSVSQHVVELNRLRIVLGSTLLALLFSGVLIFIHDSLIRHRR